ncbi:hypothetical protein GCM10025864_42650 [Luteimicrobium album]|uniref:Uncharacterized protein n=1 Tax=Luteimicrobium album TaxID=1054550 RepID=A0ABQ6I875_9MICO|nr:hypothetical protein GCM10025864_42650 [Luteimicrobium album]
MPGLALAAVGSLGRGDLGPASDLDLVLVHDGRTHDAETVTRVAERLWYPLWDAKVELDHAVRTLSQCRQVASKDLPAAVGWLDVRPVAGDPVVVHRAASAVLGDWRSASRRRLPELLASTKERADRFGELAYLIEPDLKESRGGIRDAVVLSALAATWLTDRPHGDVDRATTHLLDVRDAVHVVARRRTNRLVLQDLEEVAGVSGYDDGDALLAGLAEAGREISYALDTTVRRARQALQRPRLARPVLVRGRRAAPGCVRWATGSSSTTASWSSRSTRTPRPTRSSRCAPRRRPRARVSCSRRSRSARWRAARPCPSRGPARPVRRSSRCSAAGTPRCPCGRRSTWPAS